MNLAPIAKLLEVRIGLDAESLGNATLRTLVAERMLALGITDPAAYVNLVGSGVEEIEELTNRLLVAETWFFRGGELFATLANEIAGRTGSSSVRILCLPTATGEEPYSLAMALLDAGVPGERWSIDGVDLSKRCIDAAIKGSYREFSFRQTPADLRDRYFRPEGQNWSLDVAVRRLVQFRVGNIMDPALLSGSVYDVILCRNLLIYLTAESRVLALENLERHLAPGAILGVGHAEPQILAARGYRRFGPESCFLYRREASPEAPPIMPPIAIPARRREPPKAAVRLPMQPVPKVEPTVSLPEVRRLADQNRLDDALTLCRDCLVRIGPSAEAYSLLGVILQAAGKTSEANDAFRKALYMNPDHAEALTHAMLLSSRLGDETRAAALRDRLARQRGEQ